MCGPSAQCSDSSSLPLTPQTLLRELELSVVPKLEHKNLLPWFAIISGEKSERRPGQVSCYQIMQKMTGEYMVPVVCSMYVCMYLEGIHSACPTLTYTYICLLLEISFFINTYVHQVVSLSQTLHSAPLFQWVQSGYVGPCVHYTHNVYVCTYMWMYVCTLQVILYIYICIMYL